MVRRRDVGKGRKKRCEELIPFIALISHLPIIHYLIHPLACVCPSLVLSAEVFSPLCDRGKLETGASKKIPMGAGSSTTGSTAEQHHA